MQLITSFLAMKGSLAIFRKKFRIRNIIVKPHSNLWTNNTKRQAWVLNNMSLHWSCNALSEDATGTFFLLGGLMPPPAIEVGERDLLVGAGFTGSGFFEEMREE